MGLSRSLDLESLLMEKYKAFLNVKINGLSRHSFLVTRFVYMFHKVFSLDKFLPKYNLRKEGENHCMVNCLVSRPFPLSWALNAQTLVYLCTSLLIKY